MKLWNTLLIGGAAALWVGGCATSEPTPARTSISVPPPAISFPAAAAAPVQPTWQAAESVAETLPSAEAPPSHLAKASAQVVPPKPYTPISDLMARVADIPPADPLTSDDFAPPPGARLGHLEY